MLGPTELLSKGDTRTLGPLLATNSGQKDPLPHLHSELCLKVGEKRNSSFIQSLL